MRYPNGTVNKALSVFTQREVYEALTLMYPDRFPVKQVDGPLTGVSMGLGRDGVLHVWCKR